MTLALAHKGLAGEVESVWIDYADRSPVMAVSGQPLVPVIDHDGTVVADSLAILRHLEEQWPEPALFPSEPARRAEVELFLDWFDRVWKVAPNAIETDPGGPDVPALSGMMEAHLDRFEALLSGRDHLMGDFSAADCAAYPFLKFAAGRDPEDDEPFHRILRRAPERGRPPRAGRLDRAGGYPLRPRRSARLTASARLRTSSLRYSALVCSLIVCGDRWSSSAISRLVEPAAISASTSRSRGVSGAEGSRGLRGNTSRPAPTARTAAVTVSALESLETKPDAPAARAAWGEIQPAPEISSTRVEGNSVVIEVHSSAPECSPRNRSTSATSGW